MRKWKYYLVNMELFNNIQTKEAAYLLGLLWADGNLHKYKAKIYFRMDDYLTIKSIFDKCGIWSQWTNKKDPPEKVRIEVSSADKRFRDFLEKNEYKNKSLVNPTNILNTIPKNLHNYFLLGFFDGDGCFSISYKNNKPAHCYFALSGSYNQDWGWIEKLFEDLNIKIYTSTLRRIKNIREGDGSQIRITKLKNIIALGNYMYKNGFEIGFPRKYEKFKIILDKYNSK